jgi:phosphoribosylformimino-5-aminoimidazole carboxamide ribotide isomerase
MIIIPAIDLLNGSVVRLKQGDYGKAKYYSGESPAETARRFESYGIKRIHLVDLDAAKGEGLNNRESIRSIRKAVSCVLEAGGGIRNEDDVRELLDLGIDRLILGTVLVKDPDKARCWAERYGRKFIAGIDARNGTVHIAGWREAGAQTDIDLARRAASLGACSIVYTNIARDGMLEGPDIERTSLVAREAGIPVIVSGGVSGEKDVLAAAEFAGAGIPGIIIGKAVYEGKIDLESLVRRFPQDEAPSAAW